MILQSILPISMLMCCAEDNLSPIDRIVALCCALCNHCVSVVQFDWRNTSSTCLCNLHCVTVLLTKMFPVHLNFSHLNIHGNTNHHQVWLWKLNRHWIADWLHQWDRWLWEIGMQHTSQFWCSDTNCTLLEPKFRLRLLPCFLINQMCLFWRKRHGSIHTSSQTLAISENDVSLYFSSNSEVSGSGRVPWHTEEHNDH